MGLQLFLNVDTEIALAAVTLITTALGARWAYRLKRRKKDPREHEQREGTEALPNRGSSREELPARPPRRPPERTDGEASAPRCPAVQ